MKKGFIEKGMTRDLCINLIEAKQDYKIDGFKGSFSRDKISVKSTKGGGFAVEIDEGMDRITCGL